MAFSTNLRGLRSVAMAVLVSGSFYAADAAVPEVAEKTAKGSAKNLNKSDKNRLPNG